MPLKGDTPTNNVTKRLVYDRYGALHALVLSTVLIAHVSIITDPKLRIRLPLLPYIDCTVQFKEQDYARYRRQATGKGGVVRE